MSFDKNLRNLERELRGTTYEVFVYLLDRKARVGVRQLQREMGVPVELYKVIGMTATFMIEKPKITLETPGIDIQVTS